MTPGGGESPRQACRLALDALLESGTAPRPEERRRLATLDPGALDALLRDFADAHGAAAAGILTALADEASERTLRRAAKRALYRLGQRGLVAPAPPPARPALARAGEHAVRAWLSGVDGSGSRAAWILFEGAFGALKLCSLILNDTAGILDAAGGDITKKRLTRELGELSAAQKLPWIETDPVRAVGLVAEALALHRAQGTEPSAAFSRWRSLFETAPLAEPPALPPEPDPALVERSAELTELPELAGWFLDPETVHAEALELLQARDSRLVVSAHLKAEREAAIVARVVERSLDAPARQRWARRLAEMALMFDATGRTEHAALARATAGALTDDTREARRLPFAQGLAARALHLAGEVALGRLSAAEVSRAPGRGGGRA